MRLSMISRILIVEDKVCVTHGSRRLRWITQAEALKIIDIMRKTNSIIVLLWIQNQKTYKEQFKWNTQKLHAKFIRTAFFFKCSLDAAMFLKQLNDSNQSFNS